MIILLTVALTAWPFVRVLYECLPLPKITGVHLSSTGLLHSATCSDDVTIRDCTRHTDLSSLLREGAFCTPPLRFRPTTIASTPVWVYLARADCRTSVCTSDITCPRVHLRSIAQLVGRVRSAFHFHNVCTQQILSLIHLVTVGTHPTPGAESPVQIVQVISLATELRFRLRALEALPLNSR